MKARLTPLLLSLFISVNLCAQSESNHLLHEKLPEWAKFELKKQKLESKYMLSDFINPYYLEADFNADGKTDVAIAVIQRSSKKKGFLILINSSSNYFVFGAGTDFGNGSDNFDWMNIWRVHHDLDASENIYEDGEMVDSRALKILCPGIDVAAENGQSALIYWNGEKFVWAQNEM